MSAKVFDSGTYGCVDETAKGLLIASLDLEVSVEEVFAPNHIGEDIGLALFNEQATLNGSGLTAAADTTGQSVAAVLDIAGTGIYASDTTCSVFYVNRLSLGREQRGMQSGSFSAIARAGITDITPSTVS